MCMSFGGFVKPDIQSKPLEIIEFFSLLLLFCGLKLKTMCLTAGVCMLMVR
jgi:hypothetical protein